MSAQKPNTNTTKQQKATYTATKQPQTQQAQQKPAQQVSQAQQPSKAQQPAQNLRSPLVTCPTCQQQYPARYGKCPRCPRKFNPLIKFVLLAALIGFTVLSGLKTFSPEFYDTLASSNSVMSKVDKIIPTFNKPLGNYTVP